MNAPRSILITIITAGALAFTAPANGEPAPPEANGAHAFSRQCGICHDPGGFGAVVLARRVGAERSVLAQRTDLPPAYVRHVVRNGLRDMPPLTRVELPEPELDAIIQYLERTDRQP